MNILFLISFVYFLPFGGTSRLLCWCTYPIEICDYNLEFSNQNATQDFEINQKFEANKLKVETYVFLEARV